MWNDADHPRGQPNNSGQFVEKKGAQKNGYDSRSDIQPLKSRIISESKSHIDLPKKEYAELCSAIRTKFANKIPAKGQMLYGICYYRFNYNKQQAKIVCSYKLPINGNEKLIDDIMEDF